MVNSVYHKKMHFVKISQSIVLVYQVFPKKRFSARQIKNDQKSSLKGEVFVQPPSLGIIHDYEFDDETIEFVIPTIADKICQIQSNPQYSHELTPCVRIVVV